MTNFKDYIGMKDLKLWDGITRTFQRLTSTGGQLTSNKLGESVNVLEVYGNGSAYTDVTLNSAISAIRSNTCEIVLTPGTWTISNNVTIPSNISLRLPKGAIISINLGKTLTINGPFTAGLYNVFTTPLSATDPALSATVKFAKGITLYPEWYGAVGDNSTDNTAAIASMHRTVNAMGGYCSIHYTAGKIYNYSPQNTFSTNLYWRWFTELVDVKFVTIEGYGAELKSVVPVGWLIGDANYGNEETSIQFRTNAASGAGMCSDISVRGLKITGTYLTGGFVGDGGAAGIMLRGVYRAAIVDTNINNWSMDGVYAGATYSDTYGGREIKIINNYIDNNTRNGISIVRNDYVYIAGNTISNTHGGSFGHGVDLEPNGSNTQSNVRIIGNNFINNQRGALNIINTSKVVFSKNNLSEQYAGASPGSGAIYCDSNTTSYISDILIDGNTIITKTAALCILGSYISDFKFVNNNVLTTEDVNSSATIRIYSGTNHKNFTVSHNTFNGNGGIAVKIQEGAFWFENNTMNVSKQSAITGVFTLTTSSETLYSYIRNNTIVLDSTLTGAADVDMYCVNGEMSGNTFTGTVGTPVHFTENGAGRTNSTMKVYQNTFSPYFYMKGDTANLDIKGPGAIIEQISWETGVPYRVVSGGYYRAANGANALVGDVTYYKLTQGANVGGANKYVCTAAGTPGTWQIVDVIPATDGDAGNNPATLTVGSSRTTIVYASAITADRAVTLSTTAAYRGAKFRIVRMATATGGFNVNVGTGPLKALVPGTWCEVEYNTGWILTAYGTL